MNHQLVSTMVRPPPAHSDALQDGAGRECLEETKGVAHIALSADLAWASALGDLGAGFEWVQPTFPKWDKIWKTSTCKNSLSSTLQGLHFHK
jgi:hypothetical protein